MKKTGLMHCWQTENSETEYRQFNSDKAEFLLTQKYWNTDTKKNIIEYSLLHERDLHNFKHPDAPSQLHHSTLNILPLFSYWTEFLKAEPNCKYKTKKKLLGRGSNLLAAVSHGKGKRNQLQPNQRIWLILLFFLPKRREAGNMTMKPLHPNIKNKNELKTY